MLQCSPAQHNNQLKKERSKCSRKKTERLLGWKAWSSGTVLPRKHKALASTPEAPDTMCQVLLEALEMLQSKTLVCALLEPVY
jgi:hypothetical protein